MSTLTRFAIITFVLVGLYLLVRNSAMYNTAIGYGAQLFSRAYGALVTGRQDVQK
jgi:multisubunit Na+/H+ antiporter MnhC subunit